MAHNSNGTEKQNNSTLVSTTRIDPPASEQNEFVKNPLQFLIEIIFLALITVPIIMWNLVEKFFLSRRKSVKGKVVLITGSGRGIGQGLAREFAKLGCKVVCVDIDEDLNQETVNDLNQNYPNSAKGYKCNIMNSEEVKTLKTAVINDFGEVNILINNAGLITGASFTNFDDKFLNGVISVNLTSHFIMIREFLPEMIQRNEGHIVAIGSVCSFASGSYYSMYCATKHGVLGLMESLYYELNENPNNKIQTTTICPYFVNTSALYKKTWNLRLGWVSTEYVTEKAIDGILRNIRLFTVPSFYYYILIVDKLLPDGLRNMGRKIMHTKVSIPPREIQLNTVPYKEMYK